MGNRSPLGPLVAARTISSFESDLKAGHWERYARTLERMLQLEMVLAAPSLGVLERLEYRQALCEARLSLMCAEEYVKDAAG